MAVTRLYAPRPYDSFDPAISGVAPILATGTDVDNTKLTAVQAAATAAGLGTLPTSAGGTVPSPTSAPLRFRGAWQANTPYQYGDVVQIVDGSGNTLAYSANLNFTSGSSFSSTNWTELTFPGTAASGSAGQFNVEHYGAFGPSQTATVNAATILAAITDARAHGGGIVQFPSWVGPLDLLPSGLPIFGNVWLRGSGDGGSWVRLRAGTAAPLVVLNSANEDLFRLSDMTIDGNRDNCTSSARLISLDHTGLSLASHPGGRPTTAPTTYATFPAYSSTTTYGGAEVGSTRMLLDHLTVTNSTDDGMWMSDNGEYYVANCLVTHCAGDGIQMDAHDSSIANTTVSDVGAYGIKKKGYGRITDAKVYGWGASAAGVQITEGWETLTAVEVEQGPNDGFDFTGNFILGRGLKAHGVARYGYNVHSGSNYNDIEGMCDAALGYTPTFAVAIGDTKNRLRIQCGAVAPLATGSVVTGNDFRFNSEDGKQNVAYAATVTPDPLLGRDINIAPLTGNVTIANTTAPYDGQRMRLNITQDATGGRTITFGTAYLTNWTPDTTANKSALIDFLYTGGAWQQTNTPVAVTAQATVSDTFTRTASSTTMGVAETGQTWVPNSGTWGIAAGNLAYLALVTSQATTVVDSGLADCTVQVTLTVTGDAGICARSTDDSNHLVYDNNTGKLFKKVAGSFTPLGATAGAGANGDIIALVMAGSSLTVKRNGSTIIGPVTDSFNATATKHGLRSNGDTTARFDNLTIR